MNTPNNFFATPKESENYNYRATENSKSKYPYFGVKRASNVKLFEDIPL